ncbi:MAG: aspartate--tRNA ligase, partial [Candidatus Bipolaricaulota bacterium]
MRSDRCGELGVRDVGRRVRLAGWVHRLRDLGGITFVDLRDASGIVQVTCRDLDEAHRLSREDVIRVEGTVAQREAPNPELPTGEVEVGADALGVIAQAAPLPFAVDEEATGTTEETRLRYRSVDLRRPRMQRNLALRHRVCIAIRSYLDGHGFMEVETPVLTRSTPEGARDFLVPSRLVPGSFYALPQSPQLFKQILIASGVERYFQIVRCFRDEDLRADRQPEFTQLDLEMGFLDAPEPLFELLEGLMAHVFREAVGVELATPFPRLTYSQAMAGYGSDKPDLRFGMELVDLTDLLSDAGFRVFAQAVADGGRVCALRVPGGAELSRGDLDKVEEEAIALGAPGLSWLKRTEQLNSPLAKFVGEGVLRGVEERTGMEIRTLMSFREQVFNC